MRRFKQPVPTEAGHYYVRLHGDEHIMPARLDHWSGRLVVWTCGDDDWRASDQFDWFGPVTKMKERLR